jgi:hypothetical protein
VQAIERAEAARSNRAEVDEERIVTLSGEQLGPVAERRDGRTPSAP